MTKNKKMPKSEINLIIGKIQFLLYTEICEKEKNLHWESSVTRKENNKIISYELKIELPNKNAL